MKLPSVAPARPGDLPRLLLASGVVAVLDISFAATYWVIYRGATTFPRLLQSIAAALLGNRAFHDGTAAVALGALIHGAVALAWTIVFLGAARRWPAFALVLNGRRGALKAGLPFGVLVWLVMDLVLIPLSRANATPVVSRWFAVSLVWHAVGVGLPMAVILRDPRPSPT